MAEDDGVHIDIEEFRTLNSKEQNTIIFREIKSIRGYMLQIDKRQDKHEAEDKVKFTVASIIAGILISLYGVGKWFHVL